MPDPSSTLTAPRAAGPVPFRLPDAGMDRTFAHNTGIDFRNIRTLRLALTHRSVLHDWINVADLDAELQSNERLEFLGDALLGVIVGEYLYHVDPAADEGTLTRRRAAIVRAETLVRWARELKMQDFLYLGTGETVTQSARDRMLAGGFEALVGAIYLDRGRDVTERFVRGYLQRDMVAILATEEQTNPKGTLQEVMQERYGEPPDYETIAEEGPDHARQFTVAVVRNDERIGIGKGRSKREAQQEAARQALAALGVASASPALPADAAPVRPGTPTPASTDGGRGRSGMSRRRVRGSGRREG